MCAIPEDNDGIDPDRVADQLDNLGPRKNEIACFYFVTVNNPTCTIISNDRRRKIVELANRYALKIGVLAHAGDGNLHPLIMTDLRDSEEMARVDEAMEALYEAAIGMGGTLSGEHGIGIAKDRFMSLEFNETTMELMRGIKRVFDPDHILNPGSFL